MPSSSTPAALERAVVLQRVRDDDLERVLDADQVRQQPGAAPAGDDAEEDLGQRERRRSTSRRCGRSAFRAISMPPPSASPLMKANDGTPSSPSLPRAACARACAISTPVSRSGMSPTFDRSAPAARMNGLPVMPTASISFVAARARRGPRARLRARRSVAGPSVFGRVWSRPLSSVIEGERLAARQRDVAHERVRDDLVGVEARAASRSRSCRPRSTSLPVVVRVLPDDAAALAEADAHGGEAVADVGLLGELARRAGS